MKIKHILIGFGVLLGFTVPAAADPVTIGTAVLSWIGASTAAEVAGSTLLTLAAGAIGEATLLAASVGLSYHAPALRGPAGVARA